MESEIQRWRAKDSQRIVLVPRKKKLIKERERISLDKTIKQIQTTKLSSLLDYCSIQHKKEIETLTSGHLNPNNLLKAFKDENEKLMELLEEYDVVNHRNQHKMQTETVEVPVISKKSTVFIPENLPNQYLNVTKADQFKTFKMIDKALVERSFTHVKGAVTPKLDKLNEHLQFLEKELKELEENNDLNSGISLDRLQIYSRCFENIIAEFKTYGPLLSKIKKVYDDTIASFTSQDDELGYLRNKVQHLLAKNENRLLLKLERKKCSRLQDQINVLKEEQKKLKEETFRKLSIYAAYIPEHFLKDKLDDQNVLLQESISKIRSTIETGMDPLSCLEIQVEGLKQQVLDKTIILQELQSSIATNYVEKASKDLVDESLNQVKEKLTKVLEVNREQESTLKKFNSEYENLKSALKEKEIQYESLAKEYSELSEAAALSFDKLITTDE